MNRFVNSTLLAHQSNRHATQTHAGLIQTELPLGDDVQSSGTTGDKISSNSFARRKVQDRFKGMVGGQLTVIDECGLLESGTGECPDDLPATTVLVGDNAFYKRVLLGGTIGSAESYADGQWVSNDLTALIRLMIRNLDRFSSLEKTWARLKNAWHFFQHTLRRNSVAGSRKNIHDHYDLGNDFYQLFLDSTMNYSSGVFESSDSNTIDRDTMYDASIRKMDQICRKLQLNSLDHVLEIGTGWGGLAIYMAKKFGCRVTTTTISKEQHRFAVERVNREGLSGQVKVLLKDYRDLDGQFDKIVSVEMIEAVGHQYYDEYFRRCSKMLRDDGVMLLQSITIGEQIFDYHIRHVDFIRKYVFPGGCLPAISALASSVGRASDMRMLHQEDITPHYATTLAHWRHEFMNKLDAVRDLGYDDRFIRLWHFYLCYCEAAFAERRVHNVQLMFAKPKCALDPAVDFSEFQTRIRCGSHEQGVGHVQSSSVG